MNEDTGTPKHDEVAGRIDGLVGQVVVDELHKTLCDALAGWRYIRETHGDLYGVGWARIENRLRQQIKESAARLKILTPNAVLSGAATDNNERHADEPRPPRTRG